MLFLHFYSIDKGLVALKTDCSRLPRYKIATVKTVGKIAKTHWQVISYDGVILYELQILILMY